MRQYKPDDYFKKLQNNMVTDDDKTRFSEWMNHAGPEEVEAILDKISSYYEALEDEPFIPLSISKSIEEKINKANTLKLRRLVKRGVAIAATLAAIFAGFYFLRSRPIKNTVTLAAKPARIVPGGNKAVLTLGNGQSIILDDAKNGILANQGKIKVVKAADGKVIYANNDQSGTVNEIAVYNTISTPRGGQYQLELPDGSKVWLNAASSLRYPVHFGAGDRKVTLTGEAYFEVAKDKAHPFRVSTGNTEIKVLGTHFNVMAYQDEAASKTTLLEGSVQVSQGSSQRTIAPGEQAIVGSDIAVVKVKTSEAVEWKNGNFNFSHEKLPVIMRKIARWYDVDVKYEGQPTGLNFVGTLPRSENISEVLKYLQLTGLVHFKISERRVIVMP